jgi:hypothetical protein
MRPDKLTALKPLLAGTSALLPPVLAGTTSGSATGTVRTCARLPAVVVIRRGILLYIHTESSQHIFEKKTEINIYVFTKMNLINDYIIYVFF